MLSDLLAAEGHVSSMASDGAVALVQLEHEPPPCLILLDLLMPHMTGWELADRLAASPKLRVIPYLVLSAESPDDRDARSLRGGGRLRKPLELGRLLGAIDARCSEAPAASVTSH